MNVNRKTKPKRLLSMLLMLMMVLTLLPTMAFAEGTDTGKAIELVDSGTAANIDGYDSTNGYNYIYYGTWNDSAIKWRVLDDQTNTGGTGLFLLTDTLLSKDVYFDNSTRNSKVWQGSSAQTWCANFYSSNFSTGEQGAVIATTKSDEAFTSSTYSFPYAASENILNSDKVFFLSAQEAENSEYGFTNDAARVANYDGSARAWWLRSPNAYNIAYSAGVVRREGIVSRDHVYDGWAARPAFNLDLTSVLFTSAAVGGKSCDTVGADALNAVADNASGTEWKLTLKDDTRNSFTASLNISSSTTVAAGGSVSVDYSDAKTGSNEYISAMLVDDSGNVLYYGNIANDSESGSNQAITIPAGLAAGSYTLKIFNEQLNGDKKTDFSSEFKDIPITVTARSGTATLYDVWVDDKQVTSDNKDDILNDGSTAFYDPNSQTLTLNGYTGGAISANHALTVTLADGSTNKVTNPANNEGYCISANNNNLTINGSGDLEVIQNRYNCSAITTSAITTYTGGKLIIDMEGDLNVTTYNWHGLYAYESVTISGSGDVSICIEGNWNGNKGTGIVSETEDVILSGSGKLTVDAQNAACAVRLKASGKALLLKGTGAPLNFSAGTYAAIVNQEDKTYPVGGDNLAFYNDVTGAPNKKSVVYDHKAEPLTMEIPISTTVELGTGSVAPGAKTFEFEVEPYGNPQADITSLTIIGATIATDGAGNYTGTLKIVGDPDVIDNARGLKITEKNDGVDNWTYDDAVYIVYRDAGNGMVIQKDMGPNMNPQPVQTAEFTNTYTKNGTPAQTPTPTDKPDVKPTPTPKPATVPTGVESDVVMWSVIGLFAVICCGVFIVKRKQFNK